MATKTRERPRVPGAPYTVSQAADALNLSVRAVRELLTCGRLKGYRDGPKGKLWRIAEGDLLEYQERTMGRPGPARPRVAYKHLRSGRGR